MSRSHRKPYYPNGEGSKHWKRESNRRLRRDLEDYIDGSFFKKFNDIWSSPMEHSRGYWDVPMMRRK